MLNYPDYARSTNQFNTVIHTKINKDLKVTSIYRKFANSNFESWGWETLLWSNEKLTVQYGILDSAEHVVELHTYIVDYFNSTGKVYEEA